MWTKIDLDGLTPAPKKNSRGIFTNKKTGKSFLAASKTYRKFESAGKKMLKKMLKDGVLQETSALLKARYRFEYERNHKIADLCNLIVAINDLVQSAGVIEDDSQIKLIERAEVVSGLRNRCVIWFAPLNQAIKQSDVVGFDEVKKVFKRLPRRARIGRKSYRVLYPDLTNQSLCGQIQEKESVIQICKTLQRDEAESTILHEIIHGIDFSKNIKLTERQVLKIEAGLIDFFRRNGWKIVF